MAASAVLEKQAQNFTRSGVHKTCALYLFVQFGPSPGASAPGTGRAWVASAMQHIAPDLLSPVGFGGTNFSGKLDVENVEALQKLLPPRKATALQFDEDKSAVVTDVLQTESGAPETDAEDATAAGFMIKAEWFSSVFGLPWLDDLLGPDRASTFGFTHAGLSTAGVDGTTLESFPEAFKQGMAARAELLHDVGPSSPEYWDGALGDRNIHALFIVSSEKLRKMGAEDRCRLRGLARAISGIDVVDKASAVDVAAIHAHTREHCFTIRHMEFGEDPYVLNDGEVELVHPRREHFGFRDGISQPFVLIEGILAPGQGVPVEKPPKGGGRPMPDGTWSPVAPGEIYLGHPDEDGATAIEPVNELLREGSTYFVFRKLEQDVAGFRHFLADRRQRPDDQRRLAAQMMGRWPDGTPVVHSPDREIHPSGDGEINDFLYEKTDPHGLRCPIGAHIRRVNPRDTLNGEAARRHRILRRSLAYGGTLLADDEQALPGERRGLLFGAINARIDLQFELMQRDWINSGEQFGRVGSGKCPITGDHDGSYLDSFQEAGCTAPETHLPRFVTTKGGDYFFIPNKQALIALAYDGKESFAPDSKAVTPFAPAVGSVVAAPELLSRERLSDLAKELLSAPAPRIGRISLNTASGTPRTVAFIARHDQLLEALGRPDVFAVDHYNEIAYRLTRGALLNGMGDTQMRADRIRRMTAATQGTGIVTGLVPFVRNCLSDTLARFGPAGRIDLLQDVGFYIGYLVQQRFFGLPGARYLSPIAVATRFARYNVMETPPEWMRTLPESAPAMTPFLTMQTWTRILFAEVFANIIHRSELSVLARQAADELLQHIDVLLRQERTRPSAGKTLLAELVRSSTTAEELEEARDILVELAPAICMNVGLPFARFLEYTLPRGDLASQFAAAGVDPANDGQLSTFIHEVLRQNSAASLVFRSVTKDFALDAGGKVAEGDIAVLMLFAGSKDPRVFRDPDKLDITRAAGNYLTFGTPGATAGGFHRCWGEFIAMPILLELVRFCLNFPSLRIAAGPLPRTMPASIGMPYGIKARFTPLEH